jgi:hypothetical protein
MLQHYRAVAGSPIVDPELLYGSVRVADDGSSGEGKMRFMKHLKFTLLVAALAANAHAGEARTTYKISHSSATVTTEVAQASPAQAKILESYLFATLATNLKTFHGVNSVQISKSAATRTETVEEFEDSREYIRRYPVQIKLSLPQPVTLNFAVEESYRKCKPGYACVPSSYLKVSSQFQQDVSIDVARDSKNTLLIVSNYNLNSVILGGKGNSERTTIMVSAARALRVNNEKMVSYE